MKTATDGWGSGLLGVIIFSGSLPATRIAVSGFSPIFLTSARAVIAALLGGALHSAFRLDAEGWRKLTLRWGLFFLFLAVLNEVVWRNFSTDFWVAFKVWATIPITVLFTACQMPLIMRHSLDGRAENPGKGGE